MQNDRAGQNNRVEETVSSSVVKISQSYQSENRACASNDQPWKEGVQKHYIGISEANAKLRGTELDRTNAIESLQEYITKLIYFANSNSNILATASRAILSSLSRCNKLNRSGRNIISEFVKVLPAIVEDFNDIASKLSDQIGELEACTFTDAVSDLGNAFSRYMKEILKISRSFGRKQEVDYKPVLQKLQNLMNVIVLIGETVNKNCEATQERLETVAVLNLIFFYLANAVQGITGCALEVLREQHCSTPQGFKSCSVLLDDTLQQVLQAVKAVVFPLEKSLKGLLTVVSNTAKALNSALTHIFGLIDGVGKITASLLNA
ncbi:hypothetical protein HA402_001170 [Bradysia odoriphaga]|nr:hypothetical protein HA402_001170 [Bradysia odoriphaga]